MNFNEIKAAVRELFNGNHETANHWVKENFGNLTRKQTWQDAYDRLSETIAAQVDRAKEYIASEQGQAQIATAKAATAKALDFTADALIWVIKAVVIVALVILELARPGSIDQITGKSKEVVEALPSSTEIDRFTIDGEEYVMMRLRSPLLSSTVSIQ